MKNFTKKILCVSALILANHGNAQNYLGILQSNYAGVMAADLQPAAIVDSRFKFDLNLFSFNVTAFQNVYQFDTRDMPKWWSKSFDATKVNQSWRGPDSTFADRYVLPIKSFTDVNAKPRAANLNFQFDIINFMFHINKKIAVGFSAKHRDVVNVEDVSMKLLKLGTENLKYQPFWNINIPEALIRLNALSWNEYGVNYAQVLKDDNEHFFKVGGRVKALQGLGAVYFYSDDFEFALKNNDTTTSLKGNFNYGYSSNLETTNANANTYLNAAKLGLGLDFGVVYEFRPKYKEFKYEMDGVTDIWRRDMEKYKLRLGVSVVDVGRVKFAKGGKSRDFSINAVNSITDLKQFSKLNDLQEFDSLVDAKTLNNPTEWKSRNGNQSFYMNTPAALSIQADYHIWNRFFVNVTGVLNLNSKKDVNRVNVPNQISIIPGYDHPWFGISLPVTLNKYSGLTAGLAARLGPLTFGFQSFNTVFANGKVRGLQLFTGLRVPILYDGPHDRDKDMVSDRKDKCKDIPGIWAFQGCPDTDKDGIKDSEDSCPSIAGLLQFKGCPDTDGDGTEDSKDGCPSEKGLIQFMGCPDRDLDSIIDKNDACPDVAGIKAFAGCPDKDGDGVKDSEDKCPENAGPIVNQGCPDADNDGIFDNVDNCPKEFGSKENNGCPFPDTDKDGLLDKDDKCPLVAGPILNQGCPFQDTDKDGIMDQDDKCPGTPGVPENSGCPKISEEVAEVLKTAFENLEFQTGKAIIKPESFKSLNDLASVLAKKPEWKLLIEGHTDNQGNDAANMLLSKKRAEAVKAYLVKKAVKAANLTPKAFGETKPVADNKTEAGRQTNRRVEMTIVF
jgi:outer membrane protein OmpA-like peptidoglycan-associated protein